MLQTDAPLPPALSVTNLSPFAHLVFSALGTDDEINDVLVVKGAYELRADGDPDRGSLLELEQAPEGSGLTVVDEYFGAVNKSSVRIESDLAPYKPKCDVIVIGSAHSPSGRPTTRVDVGIDIDDRAGQRKLGHRLVVFGPRDLIRRPILERGVNSLARKLGVNSSEWLLGEPSPFLTAPLRYEIAFGGELKVMADEEAAQRLKVGDRLTDDIRQKHPDGLAAPVAHTVCRLNPLGRGFIQNWHAHATRATRYPAPQIESADAPLTADFIQALADGHDSKDTEAALTPQGFGVVTKAWQPRLKLAGTFDEAWRATRAPFLPKDFDMAYWNGAHPSMQCAHLHGGETVTLTNLLPPGAPGTRRAGHGATVTDFRLPIVDLALRTEMEDGRVIRVLLPIDTLVIDLDAMLVHVTWRLRVPGGVPFVEVQLLALSDLRDMIDAQLLAER